MVPTQCSPATDRELHELGPGWLFDWLSELEARRLVYKLQVFGNSAIQGLVALTPNYRSRFCEVTLAESAPTNIGSRGRYGGVGAHLFAIACRISFDEGFGGYVAFTAKNALIEHYGEELGAQRIGRSNRMRIGGEAASTLVSRFFGQVGRDDE